MASFIQIALGIAIFWIILYYLSKQWDLSSRGIMVAPGILVWRTEIFNPYFDKITTKFKSVLNYYSEFSNTAAIVVFFAFPILLLINIIRFFLDFASPLFVPNPVKSLNLELLLLIIFPVVVALLIHELMHGMMARHLNVEVDSSGIVILGFILSTFVKLVPESIARLELKDRLKITSSAIIANLLLALILIPLLMVSSHLVTPLYHNSEGALITEVLIDTPGMEYGLARGDIITHVRILQEGLTVQTIQTDNANTLLATLRNIPAGNKFILVMLDRELIVEGVQPPLNSELIDGSYLGISIVDYRPGRLSFLSPFFPHYLTLELQWLININLIFGLFNLLPLPMTDGGFIYDLLMSKSKLDELLLTRLKKVIYVLSILLLGLNLLMTVF
ncbi:MAG: site-2 protease family protein [Candidatus Heimdallarchaeota archaeon]|nr:site-2 protease family protein [Candidatus Heimdallarchaeota archaeon]